MALGICRAPIRVIPDRHDIHETDMAGYRVRCSHASTVAQDGDLNEG